MQIIVLFGPELDHFVKKKCVWVEGGGGGRYKVVGYS